MKTLINQLISFFTTWPGLDRYTAIGLFFSALGAMLTLYTLWKVRKAGYGLLELADERIRHHLISRITRPELLTAPAVRSLALGIQTTTGCPVITDAMIVAAIRSAAIELEGRYTGAVLLRKLKVLNAALKEIDDTVPPLLSIASTDRVMAYEMSMRTVIYLITIIQLTVLFISYRSPEFVSYSLLIVSSLAASAIYVWMIFSNVRASKYWRSLYRKMRHEDDKVPGSLERRPLRPALDFFLFQAHSNNHHYVNVYWASVWEAPYFFIGLKSFLRRHEVFNYYKERRLLKRLHGITKHAVAPVSIYIPVDKSNLEEYISLLRELWIITGSETYKEKMETAKSRLAAKAAPTAN